MDDDMRRRSYDRRLNSSSKECSSRNVNWWSSGEPEPHSGNVKRRKSGLGFVGKTSPPTHFRVRITEAAMVENMRTVIPAPFWAAWGDEEMRQGFDVVAPSKLRFRMRGSVDGGHAYLVGGWESYCEHYKVEVSDEVVFRRVFASSFDVVVIAASGVEKSNYRCGCDTWSSDSDFEDWIPCRAPVRRSCPDESDNGNGFSKHGGGKRRY